MGGGGGVRQGQNIPPKNNSVAKVVSEKLEIIPSIFLKAAGQLADYAKVGAPFLPPAATVGILAGCEGDVSRSASPGQQ